MIKNPYLLVRRGQQKMINGLKMSFSDSLGGKMYIKIDKMAKQLK
jgi:hypothetical protein